MTGASGLERGRCGAILVNVAAGGRPPPPDVPAELDVLMSLASVSQLLICGRSDLLYFRSHEVNLHSSSRELPRRYECDFLTAVTVGLNMTEMMRGKDSFLDRKKHTLSPWSPPRMEQSDGKSPREREGQPLTLCDVPDPPLSRFCLNTPSDGELTTSGAAASHAGQLCREKVFSMLGTICFCWVCSAT